MGERWLNRFPLMDGSMEVAEIVFDAHNDAGLSFKVRVCSRRKVSLQSGGIHATAMLTNPHRELRSQQTATLFQARVP